MAPEAVQEVHVVVPAVQVEAAVSAAQVQAASEEVHSEEAEIHRHQAEVIHHSEQRITTTIITAVQLRPHHLMVDTEELTIQVIAEVQAALPVVVH